MLIVLNLKFQSRNSKGPLKSVGEGMDNIFCTFYIGKNEFALHVKMIQEVVNYPEQLIKMPVAPNFLLGVFNLRGMIIPVVDLRSIMRLPQTEEGGEQKVGICDFDGVKIGVLFDRTSEILRPSADHRNNFDFLANEKKVVAGAIKLDDGERIIQIINPFVLLNVENMPAIIGKQKSRTSDFGSHAFSGRKKCITFTLDSMSMAFDITGIKEIIRVPEIKASSANMESCIGVVNLRGKTIPVVDFSKLLGIDNKIDTSSADARIIILKRERLLANANELL